MIWLTEVLSLASTSYLLVETRHGNVRSLRNLAKTKRSASGTQGHQLCSVLSNTRPGTLKIGMLGGWIHVAFEQMAPPSKSPWDMPGRPLAQAYARSWV